MKGICFKELSFNAEVPPLDKIKSLVSKMNDFEFRLDTHDNRISYRAYEKQLIDLFRLLPDDYKLEAYSYITENIRLLDI